MSFRLRWQRMQQESGWPFGPAQTMVLLPLFVLAILGGTIGLASIVAYCWSHF